MYTAQAAIGVRLGLNKRWEQIDMTTWLVKDLFAQFRIVQLTLLAPGNLSPQYATLDTLSAEYGSFAGTIAQMLTNLGSATIPLTTTPLSLNNRKAVFVDAGLAGYTAMPVSSVNQIDPTVPDVEQPNIRLTNPIKVVDYLTFFQNCLVSINGFWHLSDTDGTHGVMVVDAQKSLVKSGQGQIGLLSFEAVSSFNYVQITADMVDTTMPGRAGITLPGTLDQKSLFLVLGGYLVLVDGKALTRTSANTFVVDFTQLSIVDRYFESQNFLDLSSLPIHSLPGNPDQITVADCTTPLAILAWLQLSQSFFVVLNCPELYTQTQAVKRSGFPNLYFSYQAPTSPLRLELGRMPSYWPRYEDGMWEISLEGNVIGNKLYYENPLPSWITSSGANMPGMPGHLSFAQLLEIGRDV